MFQYAYGATEARKRNEKLFLDTSLLEIGNPRRKYELGIYVQTPLLNDPSAEEGYWQSEKYFLDHLAYSAFYRPKGPWPKLCRDLDGTFGETCFIGVRRGDYLWPERIGFHGVMPVEYYREAMKIFPENTRFVCFSDDPAWCEENLGLTCLHNEEPSWDIWLMSQCKHAIIANSTFHWWGAWLGADKCGTVVAPKKWFVTSVAGMEDIVPFRWVTL